MPSGCGLATDLPRASLHARHASGGLACVTWPEKESGRAQLEVSKAARPLRDRKFADSPLEGKGFEPVWGFSCQVVVFGFLPVLCSERESRSSFFNRAAGGKRIFPLEAVSSSWPVDRCAKKDPSWRWGRLVPVANRRAARGRCLFAHRGKPGWHSVAVFEHAASGRGHGSFRGLPDDERAATWRREGRHRYVPCAIINAKACRNEERGVAVPRPGGTRLRLGSADCGKLLPSHGAQAAVDGIAVQRYSLRSLQIRCMMTASLRATATLARRMPIRFASPRPQLFNVEARASRWSSTAAAS